MEAGGFPLTSSHCLDRLISRKIGSNRPSPGSEIRLTTPVVLISGDGIGPEVTSATKTIVEGAG